MNNDNPLVCPTCGKRHACEHGHAPVRLNAIAPTWIKENPLLNDYQIADKYGCSQPTIQRARVELKKHDVFSEMPTHKQSANGKQRPTTYTKKPKEPKKSGPIDVTKAPTKGDMLYLCTLSIQSTVDNLPDLEDEDFMECLTGILKKRKAARKRAANRKKTNTTSNHNLETMETANVTSH
jgi:hypothetical protein